MAAKGEIKKPELSNASGEKCREFLKSLSLNASHAALFHPLTFAKVLFQLGHEPYPAQFGKSYVYFGRDAYYLPNVFSYLRNIVNESGVLALYRGVEANIVANIVGALTSFSVTMYMDRYWPNIGGNVEKLSDKEEELSDYESLRVKVRQAIRDTISCSIGTLVSRPFAVIMIREIAQYIGGECKYPNVWTSFWRIGREEGPSGYFAGLIPNLIAGYISIWGTMAIRYAAERFLENTYDKDDELAVKSVKDVRFVLSYAIPFIVGTITYPFNVVSSVLAVSGSSLVASFLPNSPIFNHWSDAYSYLHPHGLSRGAKMFNREQSSP